MTDWGDPISRPFWSAARRHTLVVQRCESCGQHQFYPRPFCIACQSDAVAFVPVAGTGTIYSQITVRIRATEDHDPPYVCAVVELDEGPRLLTNIDGLDSSIGDRVEVRWRERGALPPLPVFSVARRPQQAARADGFQ